MGVGNRVFLERDLPSKELIEKFSKLPAANVADVMGRSCAMHSEIKLMSQPSKSIMCGPALTVKARPGDNLMIHAALDMSQPGDIIVVSNEGDRSQSLMGQIMMEYAASFLKLGGIVLDGPIRDIDSIGLMDFPVYATGTTPGGPYKEGPGEVNVPIACGKISVNPGDIILGDEDGVIVIPLKDAEEIYEKAAVLSANDHAKVEAAKIGSNDRSWVNKLLDAKKVEFIEGKHS
ncbi:RraA family protein [Neobacillus sp. LXY-4]|uniref:RraA family protein n=1 Tax=Neobacillus sp. LXY-4 TaxID=3379826 RepID=UPI003EDEDA14